MRSMHLFVVGGALALSALSQANAQTTIAVESPGPAPMYRVVVTSRTVQAVNYGHRNGASEVGFAGTALLPSAEGTAKVRSKRGTLEVEAEFGSLQTPTTFGGEYLTYVLWAISPEGRAANLGEVLVGDNGRSKLTATTDLQAFALIVTAEPYFAVREPSNVVVLENVVRADTKGTSEEVNAKYELMERGGYLPTGYKFDPVVLSANLPLELQLSAAVRKPPQPGFPTLPGSNRSGRHDVGEPLPMGLGQEEDVVHGFSEPRDRVQLAALVEAETGVTIRVQTLRNPLEHRHVARFEAQHRLHFAEHPLAALERHLLGAFDVELDEVRLEVGDRAQPRVAAARVVDRETEAPLAEETQAFAEFRVVLDRRAFGDLDDHALGILYLVLVERRIAEIVRVDVQKEQLVWL